MSATWPSKDALGTCARLSMALAVAGLSAGCAEAPFSVHAADNDEKTLRLALGRVTPRTPGPENGTGHAMAYVFAGAERHAEKDRAPAASVEATLYGYDLTEGKQVFAVPAEVRSRFAVGRGVLVHREGEGEIVVRDARTGQARAHVPFDRGQVLVGLCADDDRFYYVTQHKGAGPRESQVTAVSFDGLRAWSLPAPGSAGAPAALGGVVAVPFRYQDVVLLDGKTGLELSRIRQKDEQINFVRAADDGFYYGVGDRGVARLDERSVAGLKGQIAYLSPNLGDKVRVFLYWDGYRAEQADFSAFDRNRLLWSAVRKGDGIALRDDLAVLHSYRFLFAVSGSGGQVRWAYAQPRHNLMASTETEGAVLFASQDGELGALDIKTGAKVMSQHMQLRPGQQVLGATFDAAGFAPKGDAQAPDVLSVLHGIIFDKDSSFIAVKSFAVQAVNSLPGKEATAELLRVVTAEAMPSQVTRTAGEALVARQDRDVAAMLVEALGRRYDFLENRQPRGVAILARAAAAIGIKEAVPALTQQLFDPVTAPWALKDLVAALIKVGEGQAIQPLRDLLLLYRSDPLFEKDAEPLKMAAEGLIRLGGEPERMLISFVAEEPRTLRPLATHLHKILDETAVKPKP